MELSGMRGKLEEAEEKKRAAQATLDAAYKFVLYRFPGLKYGICISNMFKEATELWL